MGQAARSGGGGYDSSTSPQLAEELFDERWLEPLAHATRDDDVTVRRLAVTLLEEVDSPARVPALIAALDDSDDTVRASALNALRAITRRERRRRADSRSHRRRTRALEPR